MKKNAGKYRVMVSAWLGLNAVFVIANAVFVLPLPQSRVNMMDASFVILALPLLAGVIGVAAGQRWGRILSATALTVEVVLFSLYLRTVWGSLHGGEWILVIWIGFAASGLALLSVRKMGW